MKHELKIIVKCESEDIEDNGNPPTNSNIAIYLNFDDPSIDSSFFKKETNTYNQPTNQPTTLYV